jgi:hypothetical protein
VQIALEADAPLNIYTHTHKHACMHMHIYTQKNPSNQGRAIAQVVSRRFTTVAARVRAWVRSCGICGGQSSTGAGYLRVFRFPLPVFISPVAPQSPSSGAGIIGQLWLQYQVDSVLPH